MLADATTLAPAAAQGHSFDDIVVSGDELVVAVGLQYLTAPQRNVGRLVRVPTNGGASTVLADEIPGYVAGLAIASDRVIYAAAHTPCLCRCRSREGHPSLLQQA